MKYPCLVLDHDDTVVNSTATIHHPCFQAFLDLYRPGSVISLDDYFLQNFDAGFLGLCHDRYHMTDEEIALEQKFWEQYAQSHTPAAYPGIRELLWQHQRAGGIICVASHSMAENILRAYRVNGLPEPALIFGWDDPPELRKPSTYALETIMTRFGLRPDQLLMIDDAKPGCDMAHAVGVDFAAVGWAHNIPVLERYMYLHCEQYFRTVDELASYLQKVNGYPA